MVKKLFESQKSDEKNFMIKKLAFEFADELGLLDVEIAISEDEIRVIRMEQNDMKAKLERMKMGKQEQKNVEIKRFKLNLSNTLIDENTGVYYSYADGSIHSNNFQKSSFDLKTFTADNLFNIFKKIKVESLKIMKELNK
jgi:murein tripeptide amidase MpaA